MNIDKKMQKMRDKAASHFQDGDTKSDGNSLFAWADTPVATVKCHMLKDGKTIEWFAWDDEERGGKITESRARSILEGATI